MAIFMVERTEMSTRTWLVEADTEEQARESDYMQEEPDDELHFGNPTIEVTEQAPVLAR